MGEGLELLDQLRELQPAVVVLTGGDPLKRPDLALLLAAAARRGLPIAIAPSVTPLLTVDAIHRLADGGVTRIALSLDGPDAAVHDTFRGTPLSFRATTRAIATVQGLGLPLQINTSLTPRTVAAVPGMMRLIESIAPALWSVFFVVPTGRARADQQLDAQTCEGLFEDFYEWTHRTGLPMKTTAAPAFRRVVVQRGASRARALGGPRRPTPPAVNDGKGFVFISHTGEVYPSGFLPLSAGNIRSERLATIYRTSPLFRALRSDWRLEGKCGRCPFRALCGGSRARAFATTGNPFAEDPACAYQPDAQTGSA